MEQCTLELISIVALVVALIAFMIVMAVWVNAKRFIGSGVYDKMGGGRHFGTVFVVDNDITNFKDNCEKIQNAILSGETLVELDMIRIVNVICLTIYTNDNDFKKSITPLNTYSKHTRQDLLYIIRDGLRSMPLAAFIIMACPYMFNTNIRNAYNYKSYYHMLIELPTFPTSFMKKVKTENKMIKTIADQREFLKNNYFKPICDEIYNKVSNKITDSYIRGTWSNDDLTLGAITMIFSYMLENNTLGTTAKKVANALQNIVIPDVYVTIISNGDNLPTNEPRDTTLKLLPISGEAEFKWTPPPPTTEQ